MAQQSKSTLQSAINTQLADNTSGDISAADVRDNLINMTDSLLFNNGSTQTLTGALTVTDGITGSLQGTATTASYVVTAQTASYVLNAVSSSFATTASFVTSASYSSMADTSSKIFTNGSITGGNLYFFVSPNNPAGGTAVSMATSNLAYDSDNNILNTTSSRAISASNATTASYVVTAQTASYVENAQTASYVENAQTASYVENAVSASYAAVAETLLGSVTSASYAVTSSLSQTTIGAGDFAGAIQFKGGTGPGSPEGKNTWSSTFTWNVFNSGLNIGDPNTTGGYGTGDYYLAVGYDAVAAGFAAAFGSSSYAQGEGSFSHGQEVTATAAYSHAEGYSTVTLGQFSHAEGYNTSATGNNSHAEGANTTSTGQSSHAEGISTNAQGSYSHAEGQITVALGQASHAEGLGTVASGSFQHVQGRYNTPGDTTSLMIVGNGTFDTPSDAFKVRMSGSIVLPTTQSAAPSWTGTDGEIVPATVGGQYFLYMWMNGAWRSGSFV